MMDENEMDGWGEESQFDWIGDGDWDGMGWVGLGLRMEQILVYIEVDLWLMEWLQCIVGGWEVL